MIFFPKPFIYRFYGIVNHKISQIYRIFKDDKFAIDSKKRFWLNKKIVEDCFEDYFLF